MSQSTVNASKAQHRQAEWLRRARVFRYIRGIVCVLMTVGGWAAGPYQDDRRLTAGDAVTQATFMVLFYGIWVLPLHFMLFSKTGQWKTRSPLIELGHSHGRPSARKVIGAFARESFFALALFVLAFWLGTALCTYWAALRGHYR